MDSDSDYSDDELDRLNDTIFLHPENPYVKPYIHNQIFIYNGSPVIANDEIITMPKQYINLARDLESKTCYIRWLLVLQIILVIPYCYTIIGIYYFIYTFLIGVVSLSCCYNYTKTRMLIYICYNVSQIGVKIGYFCFTIYTVHDNAKLINNTINPYYVIGGQSLIICIDIPILIYIIHYYNILPKITYIPNSIMI